jgi:ATP phosphoribosyltransferase
MNIQHSLTIALTKGRILDETLPLLAAVGIEPTEDLESSRKLIISTTVSSIQLVVLRGSDVPTYVRHGAADLGIAGKDMLLEFGGDGIYEPLDLGIARCRLMTAAPKGRSPSGNSRRIRVATKLLNVARAHYARKGVNADLIKLYGSMELAPLMGLADEIVDIVDTGKTLAENGMEALEEIAEISSRLIVNKAAMRTRHSSVMALIDALSTVLKERGMVASE